VTLEIVTCQCAMISLKEPYKPCRSKPWHNQTMSSGWEYKHLSTSSILLLEDSIAQAARSKRNWTFTKINPPCLHSVNFTAEICITAQINLLGLQMLDLLRIVRKIPAIFTIMFISGREHFHLGDLSVLRSTNGVVKYPSVLQLSTEVAQFRHMVQLVLIRFSFCLPR